MKKISIIAVILATFLSLSVILSSCSQNRDDQVSTYTISYNLDGGINSASNPDKYDSKTDSITFQSPTKRAHKFLGWATSADGDVVYTDKISYKGKGDITLYAKWLYAPTNTEYIEDFVVKDYPDKVLRSIQQKIEFDYSAMGFEVYSTQVSGCYAVCYFYPDMVNEDDIIPCGIILINFPLSSRVPIEIEVSWNEYKLLSCFEAEGLGQYQYKEDNEYFLYDTQGSIAYIEHYKTVEEVDAAIANGTSRWDIELYPWDYDTNDFLTIPFDLIEDYDPSGEWKLFGDYTTVALIEQIQQLNVELNASNIETFSGVFLSNELAKYVEQCMLKGTQIYLNNVPFDKVIELAAEKTRAGKLLVIELDGSIGEMNWLDEWTCQDQKNMFQEQVAQLQRSLIFMGASVVIGLALAPYTAGASLPAAMLVGGLFGGGAELLQQLYVEDKAWSEIDWGAVSLQFCLGSITAGISTAVCTWAQSVARTSITLARVIPTLMRGLDIALDVGATVLYDIYQGYTWDQIRSDVAMTVVTNIVISTITASCFEAGTMIATPYGDKPIEDIHVGDEVFSFVNGSRIVSRVVNTYQRRATIWSVGLSNGEVVKTTATHPFYANNYFIQAQFLEPNDKLLLVNGEYVEVEYIQQEIYCADVFNFEVEGSHTYYADDVLVHNSCGPKVEQLIYSGYDDVPHKSNYSPKNPEKLTEVYLLTVKESALNKEVDGHILDIFPNMKGKKYGEVCVFYDGKYILKVGTTSNDIRIRYPSDVSFQKRYGLDFSKDIIPEPIVMSTKFEAEMIESQIIKNLTTVAQKPLPGNSNWVEYTRTTRYNYKVDLDISNLKIKWMIDNLGGYLGYGN